jgi:hypothetical protein
MYRHLLIAVISILFSFSAYMQLQQPVSAVTQDSYLLRVFLLILCTYLSLAFTLFFLMSWDLKRNNPRT